MPLARTRSVALSGVQGRVVEVEADIGQGLPGTTLVGLPDASVAESRDRCRAAVSNSGFDWPNRRLTVGLSPASLRKTGSHYDLAIALAVLAAYDVVPRERIEGVMVLGELALDGRLRAVPGVLPATLAAHRAGIDQVIVPEANASEAALVTGVAVLGARSLAQAAAVLRDEEPPEAPPVPPLADEGALSWRGDERLRGIDLADVVGQVLARRAVEVAAAGGHHLFLDGPPGAGKTMLAERLPGLMPDLDEAESLEVTAVHSVAGALPADVPLLTRPPFVDPHHTASTVSIVGGGSRVIRPGSISLAHRGVLFLDEAPEFRADALEALRQPLESGEIVVGRAAAQSRFPARIVLVLAANPCPCGRNYGKGLLCECTPAVQRRYRNRLSGPVRDRVDVTQVMHPLTPHQMRSELQSVETSATVAARVRVARERQWERLSGLPWRRNGDIPGPELRRRFPVAPRAMRVPYQLVQQGVLTARGADRVVRISWTLADLAGVDPPGSEQVDEALELRTGVPLGVLLRRRAS
ncbi:MAG: YifB family Mg chelatase-like AAA ATPase [Propionibacteriales bacterium]|nr:YifB family Mg chelatase-like AAA ATPase [Propionibacteriales bacterium]